MASAPLLGFLIDVLRLSAWLILLSTLFVPMERLFALHRQPVLRPALLTDLGYYFLNSLLTGAALGVPLAALAWQTHRLLPAGFQHAADALPLAVRVPLAFLIGEMGFYWGHRLVHAVPLMWRFHEIHHAAEQMDFLVNTRAHPVDEVFVRLCGLVPLYALGLAKPAGTAGSVVPLIIVVFGTVWGFFVHSNVRWRLGRLEWLIATPAFHHWHHTSAAPLNRNYAATLPVLDRLFRTHHLPAVWPTTYGTAGSVANSLSRQLTAPLRPQVGPIVDGPVGFGPRLFRKSGPGPSCGAVK